MMLLRRITNIVLLWTTVLILTITTSAGNTVSEITTQPLNSAEVTQKTAASSVTPRVYSLSGFFYTLEDGKATITGCTDSNALTLSIPAKLGYYKVAGIGPQAFYGMKSLLTVSIADGVPEIGALAFSGCNNLMSVSIGNGTTFIQGSAFYKCTNLKTVILGSAVTSIGGAAFRYCEKLEEIVLPDSVTSIDSYAFADCTALTQLKIPDNVTSLGSHAFYRCSKITDITIGSGLTEISENAFSDCDSLASISIPQNVTCVGESAFYHCSSLQEIHLPDTLSSIGRSAFSGTGYISNEENWLNDALYIDNYLISVRNFSGAEYVFRPETIGIAARVFSGYDSLTSVTLPERLKYLGEGVFSNCTNLKYVILNDALEHIAPLAFLGCVSLTDVYYEGTAATWNTIHMDDDDILPTNATLHCLGGKACKVTIDTQNAHSFFVMVGMGSAVSEPSVPHRVGYYVEGWYTDEACTDAYDFAAPVTGPMVLYAHWAARTIVTFQPYGGTMSLQSIQVAVNSPYGELPAPIMTGYTFDGWYTNSLTNGDRVTSETIVSQPADHTLYARWKANTYVVTFDANGGAVDLPSMEAAYYQYYSDLPAPTRNGYSFLGWYTAIDGGDKVTAGSDRVEIAENHTLYAHWKANSYYVTFKTNGGGFTSGSSTIRTCDTPFGNLPTPHWINHTFTGWYTAAIGGEQITSETIATYELLRTPLYAHWAVAVTLNANQGVVDPQSVNTPMDAAYEELPVPTRMGYIFDGWYTAEDGGEKVISGVTICPKSAHTLYAHWTRNDSVVVVGFDANGGTVHESGREVPKGTAHGELPIPFRNGYTFTGWYTAADGGERITGETIVSTVDEQQYTQVLYAHWSADAYPVSFDVNGGQAQEFDKTVTCDTPFGQLPIPVRTGYTFVGWYTAAASGQEISGNTNASFDLLSGTLYAHWRANSYTVSFHTNSSAANPANLTVTYDSAYGTLPAVNRQGYIFDGWYTAAIGGEPVTEDSLVSITEHQTLYAHWSTAIIRAAIWEQGDASAAIRLSGDTEILKDGAVILAACYDETGKMTDGAFGTFDSATGSVVFAKNVGTNWTIFFLDSSTLTPYCKQTPLA